MELCRSYPLTPAPAAGTHLAGEGDQL